MRMYNDTLPAIFPKLPILRSMIAESVESDKNTKIAKTKTNSAISDRRIQKNDFLFMLHWTHIQRIMRVANELLRRCRNN